jgi:hypothetical protein
MGEGMEISFPHINEECGLCGTCKKKLIQIQEEYDSILLSETVSPTVWAMKADFVFTRTPLHYCIEQDITCHSFQISKSSDLKRIRGMIFDLDGTLIAAYEGFI